MKILQITPSLINGGAERFIIDLCNELSFNGQDVTLISLERQKKNDLTNELSCSIKLIRLNKKKGFDFKCLLDLNKIIFNQKFDIIHTHTRALNYLNPFNFLILKSKFIHTIHNSAVKEEKYALVRKFRKYLFKLKLVNPITISNDSDLSFEKYYQTERKLIFNGTRVISKTTSFDLVKNEVEGLKLNSKTKVIVNIARVSKQKNQKSLINIFARLKSEHENVILLIIGRLTDKEYLKEINQYLPENVFILGSRENATDFLFVADGFCLSSKWEGMPISLIESFCTQTIPICTPAGGVKNMIKNNYNGFLSNEINEITLYDQFKLFLKMDINTADKLKKNCLVSFEKFYSMKICSNNYLNYYNSLLK